MLLPIYSQRHVNGNAASLYWFTERRRANLNGWWRMRFRTWPFPKRTSSFSFGLTRWTGFLKNFLSFFDVTGIAGIFFCCCAIDLFVFLKDGFDRNLKQSNTTLTKVVTSRCELFNFLHLFFFFIFPSLCDTSLLSIPRTNFRRTERVSTVQKCILNHILRSQTVRYLMKSW